MYRERVIEHIVTDIGIHEYGHTVSLRHNFYGSADWMHMREGSRRICAALTAKDTCEAETRATCMWEASTSACIVAGEFEREFVCAKQSSDRAACYNETTTACQWATCRGDCGEVRTGDGKCDYKGGERRTNSPDCTCGDGICEPAERSTGLGSAPCDQDCPDLTCDNHNGTDKATCEAEAARKCSWQASDSTCIPLGRGDGFCDVVRGEDSARTPEDCNCGDNICDDAESAAPATGSACIPVDRATMVTACASHSDNASCRQEPNAVCTWNGTTCTSVHPASVVGAEITASIMDYVRSQENSGFMRKWGLYDEAALKWIYGTWPVRDAMMQEDFLYCTDEHADQSPLCRRHDLGITPSQIVLNDIERYDWLYEMRNRRSYRTFWDTSTYYGSVYSGVFPLLRFWYMSLFDWGGGGVQDILKRLDQKEHESDPAHPVLTPQQYNEIATDFVNDAIAANGLIMAFYDAVLSQSASFRNFQTEYDPYYGDIMRIGIVADKLYTTVAFMDFQEVNDYNPNVYTYVAMYDSPYGNRNVILSKRVLDDMLGANYDTFPWFKYLALNVFASAANSNLIGDIKLKDRIRIDRYNSREAFEEVFGTGVWQQIERPDNIAKFFFVNGEQYVYSYETERNWHLVARKSESPVSFSYMKDYNEALAAGDTGTDNFGLKILLAYHEYYNNFSGY
jgi:hypothetical protein